MSGEEYRQRVQVLLNHFLDQLASVTPASSHIVPIGQSVPIVPSRSSTIDSQQQFAIHHQQQYCYPYSLLPPTTQISRNTVFTILIIVSIFTGIAIGFGISLLIRAK